MRWNWFANNLESEERLSGKLIRPWLTPSAFLTLRPDPTMSCLVSPQQFTWETKFHFHLLTGASISLSDLSGYSTFYLEIFISDLSWPIPVLLHFSVQTLSPSFFLTHHNLLRCLPFRMHLLKFSHYGTNLLHWINVNRLWVPEV